ncbi:hypothetical protein [Amycolatopsis sp. CA-230715]|uniref:hypothetical protein n=1 Tax=Amycolatopsis sp. CA-230715 TaxID=2745196 RepID=UPI001C00CA3E|nr:hypothetical protein [Amycolatopsis sp. CA-230715]QWF85899.1 hypothetical protein HUW46_09379 [Amycolatopsis sp. CA-230715]
MSDSESLADVYGQRSARALISAVVELSRRDPDEILSLRQHGLLARAEGVAAADLDSGSDPADYGGPDAVEGLLATAVDLYHHYGDRDGVLTTEQAKLIDRAAVDLGLADAEPEA